MRRYVAEGNLDFMNAKIPSLKNSSIDCYDTTVNDNKPLKDILAEVEKKMIHERLLKNSWNKTQTANDLKIDRKTLLTKIKTYQLKEPE